MGQPITTASQGICFAFPDVCQTPAGVAFVPIPYPNIGQLADATGTANSVLAGGNPVVTSGSSIPSTTGDEAGTGLGVAVASIQGEVRFVSFSATVRAEGQNVVRLLDTTTQNQGNAVGQVLGGVPNVLAGG